MRRAGTNYLAQDTQTAGEQKPPLFEAIDISKSFGEVEANKDISLSVRAGEILALLGENGAGKSTLVKMIDGVLKPDRGEFRWNGRKVSISSPAIAKRLGIAMIFQHFSNFEALTVLENLALALPDRSMRAVRRDVAEISERYGLSINPNILVERLSAGEKQRVEIARALLQQPKLLILDEPTSVLTPQESTNLFNTLDVLANEGVAMIYISHRLSEIKELCDNAVVLRQGQIVGTCDPETTSVSEIAEMMIGKTADPIKRTGAFVGKARLSVENLSLSVVEGTSLDKVSFTARRGEIMGIAGIAGEGQEALFGALSGELRTRAPRSIRIDDKAIGAMGPTARRRLGMAFAPEQRLGHAAVSDLPLSENLRLTRHGIQALSGGKLKKKSRNIRETYDVRAAANDAKAGTLSGGNLQKFVIGRELERDPDVFVVAQPTWGVDAGAASFIRNELLAMTQRGGTVIVISQDLDEIFQIADRVAVLHRGALSDTYPIDDMTPEKIGLLMSGESLSSTPEQSETVQRKRRKRETAPQDAIAAASLTDTTPPPTEFAPAAPDTRPAPAPAAAQPQPAPPSPKTLEPLQVVAQMSHYLPPQQSAPPPAAPPPPRAISTRGTVTASWTPHDDLDRSGLHR